MAATNKRKYAVFTMDVETFTDTDCIRNAGITPDADLLDGFDSYISLLNKYNIKSTLFTVGDLVPKIADRLTQCIQDGHRLALHNYQHIAPMHIPPQEFKVHTRAAKEQLSRLFDTEIQGFRAPCFSIDKERLDILRELGFQYDSSHLGFQRARHVVDLDLTGFHQVRKGIHRKDDFFEFELSKEKLFGFPLPISGGGYVRIAKWHVIKAMIRHYLRRSDYYVFYIHPFELTKEKIPILRDLKPYENYYLSTGIRSYAKKVEYIIQLLIFLGYEFVTFEELTEIIKKEHPSDTK